MRSDSWGSDVPISEPQPAREEIKVDFKGFAFTTGGVVFSITPSEVEEIFSPAYLPEGYIGVEDDDQPLITNEDLWGSPEGVPDGG